MGMYTLLTVDVTLKADTPSVVLRLLDFMLDARQLDVPVGLELPQHALFETSGWRCMLTMTSAYFQEPTASTLVGRRLRVQCNFKNYGNELKYFLEWLAPHVDAAALPRLRGLPYLGRSRYEECDFSTHLFLQGSTVKTFADRRHELPDYTAADGYWPGSEGEIDG